MADEMIIDEFSDLVKISLVDKIVATLCGEIDLDNDNDQHKEHHQEGHHTDLVDQKLVGADVAGEVLKVAGNQEVVTEPASLTLHRSETHSAPDLPDVAAPDLRVSSSHHHHHWSPARSLDTPPSPRPPHHSS